MRKVMLYLLPAVAGGVALLHLGGCATEPVTGRKQLMLVSSSEEQQLGLTEFEKMKKEVPISKDKANADLVTRVGQRVAKVAAPDLPNAQWEFVLFESAEPNAFCLPGGKVGVYTGILPITKDETGLATVIGHEVAHAAAHHGAERMSEAMAMGTVGSLASGYLGSEKPDLQPYFDSLYGLGTQVGRALPHSRGQEARADEIGLIYMARAGYDPAAAVDFWRRFAAFNQAHGGSETPWFLRTHPLDEDRIANLQKLLPRAKQEFRPAP